VWDKGCEKHGREGGLKFTDLESTTWKSGERMKEKPRDDQKEADRFEYKIS
jgi:hypothetical protein